MSNPPHHRAIAPLKNEPRLASRRGRRPLAHRLAWPAACIGVCLALQGCGGSGTDPTSAPAAGTGGTGGNGGNTQTTSWLSAASHVAVDGTADGGLDGDLMVVRTDQAGSAQALVPARAVSASMRVWGGSVDATLGSLSGTSVRTLVYDAPVPPVAGGTGSPVGLFKVALAAQGSFAPTAQRLSDEAAMCPGTGSRFSVIGQSLAGDEAVIHYQAATAATSCAQGGEPRLVTLAMSATDAPIALDAAADARVTPIGPIHNGSGRVAAFLGWQADQFVRTDATLRQASPLAAGDLAAPIDAQAAPAGAGWVTRFGIFVFSADGLRRYDKSTGRLSAVLVVGTVGRDSLTPVAADDDALYVVQTTAAGTLDLWRVADTPAATATRLNTEGALDPVGFRLTRSYVLYAVSGRTDWTAWRKADGQRLPVLADRAIGHASTSSDTLFVSRQATGGGKEWLRVGADGAGETSLDAGVQLLAGGVAEVHSPFARLLRGNAPFSHVLALVPAGGAAGLSGAAVRWLPFDAAAAPVEAGTLPAGLGATAQSPGVVGTSAVFAIETTGGARRFTVRREAGSLLAAEPAP